MQDASSDLVPRGQTHTHAEKELGLRRGKQEQTVRSHQPHHTLYYADLGVYCKLIRNPRVTGGHQLKGYVYRERKTCSLSLSS